MKRFDPEIFTLEKVSMADMLNRIERKNTLSTTDIE